MKYQLGLGLGPMRACVSNQISLSREVAQPEIGIGLGVALGLGIGIVL